VFLFSDGEATDGLRTSKELGEICAKMHKEVGIITSTFGIGDDFNYDVMSGIALQGHGTYFFIDKGENIPKLVEKGLRGLTSLLAIDSVLRVKPLSSSVKKFNVRTRR